MSLHSYLIERLNVLHGPSRECDFSIAFATEHRPTSPDADYFVAESFAQHEKKHGFATAWSAHSPWHEHFGVPRFTADLNAPVKLLERILPGFIWKMGTCSVSDDAWVVPDFNCPVHGERLLKQFGEPIAGSVWDVGFDIDQRPAGRPAIAMCVAVLTAYDAVQNFNINKNVGAK